MCKKKTTKKKKSNEGNNRCRERSGASMNAYRIFFFLHSGIKKQDQKGYS